ncbi:MAG TPA: ABC transporter ATP-binding protein [Gemmataceae bacterium]|nr:ABC transporter ATP-binding protein [Gemmataceae bacterium]
MPPSIRVEGLSKRYRVNGAGGGAAYRTLRESLTEWAAGWLRRRPSGGAVRDFWALKDVDFDIQPGEVVGVIGRNGAGKSTLLKILSRITHPTAGQVELRGRVGSLLEVGTGFHPELTGRENIYLNGAILGMKRREITRQFGDIVEFAELGEFIDTPVKRYSSGMYVRLAFAVAAHITPEILLVDEVLAVGDHAFQRKCLGQMGAIARGGRTVLVVTHQMEVVQHLCANALLFERGRLALRGETKAVVNHYLASQETLMDTPLAERTDRTGGVQLRFTDAWVEDAEGRRAASVLTGQTVKIVATYELAAGAVVRRPSFSFPLYTPQGAPVTQFGNAVSGDAFPGRMPQKGRVECLIPRLPLNVGRYVFNVLAATDPDGEWLDWVPNAGQLVVEKGDYFGSGKLSESKFPYMADHSWTLTAQEEPAHRREERPPQAVTLEPTA